MADSELAALRAEYKQVTGKNPSPGFNAETLRERIAAASNPEPQVDQAEPAAEPAQVGEPEAESVFIPMVHADGGNSDHFKKNKAGHHLVPAHELDVAMSHGFIVVED